MAASLIPQSNCGITVFEEDGGGVNGSSLYSSFGNLSSESVDSSSSSDYMDDATSAKKRPLYEMSALMTQLPLKRGLSKFYQGKSRSFACLSSVRSLEDLVKPERPAKKKLKLSSSCGGGLNSPLRSPPPVMGHSRVITKKGSKRSLCSSISTARRHDNMLSSRPPIPPQRAGNICSHPLRFA